MKIEFDPIKNNKNIRQRKLSFDQVVDFNWVDAIIIQDIRKPYPEDRFVAVGYLGLRLHVLCFTPISEGIRVISFRKANKREVQKYEKALAIDK
jgi:uncharacterized protein